MKILLISNCAFNINQGSGYGIINFYFKGLRAQGVIVEAFEPDQYESFKFIRPYANSYRQALGMMLLALSKVIFRKYDVIVCYGAESFAAVWMLKKLFGKIPVIIHSNGIENHSIDALKEQFGFSTIDNAPPKWYQIDRYKMFLSAFQNADFVITNGSFDTDYLLKNKIKPGSKVKGIEYGLDNEFLSLPEVIKKEKIITYCGTWIARKGVDILQHDINLFLAEHQDFQFYIIGCGKDFKKEDYFNPSVTERIKVFPFISDKNELMSFYLKTMFFVFPSYYDSFGLVLSEAMACGCTAITTNTGFAYSLNHLENCFKIEKTKNSLLNALKELVVNENLNLKIAGNGKKYVQQLSWPTRIQTLKKLIEEQIYQFKKEEK